MKNKLSYFIGVAFVLCYTSTFTSCINGVDDECLEQKLSGEGESNNEEEEEIPDLNGNYCAGGDFDLTMTYNGEELTGKKVTVAADEMNETAVITLAGIEQDLSSLVGGLVPFSFTGFSPIPGVKEITFTDVKLYKRDGAYQFAGEETNPAYTLTYQGTIDNEKMNISIKHQLVNQKLAGTWNLAPIKNTGNSKDFAPLWCDWQSEMITSLGIVYIDMFGTGKLSELKLNKYNFNGIFTLLAGSLSPVVMNMLLGQTIGLENIVGNTLRDITAEGNGCMFATYSYSGDLQKPEWSSEMPHNALRYYYGKEGQIYLEANTDLIVSLIGGLINPAITRADPQVTVQLGKELVALLVPVLQEGIPCDYVLDGNNLTINIDGQLLKAILSKLMQLANDEVAHPYVMDFISTLGDFSTNIEELLNTMPDALKYQKINKETGEPEGECGDIKLGLRFVKG